MRYILGLGWRTPILVNSLCQEVYMELNDTEELLLDGLLGELIKRSPNWYLEALQEMEIPKEAVEQLSCKLSINYWQNYGMMFSQDELTDEAITAWIEEYPGFYKHPA